MIEIRFLALTIIKLWLKRQLRERDRVFFIGFYEGCEERIYKASIVLIEWEGELN